MARSAFMPRCTRMVTFYGQRTEHTQPEAITIFQRTFTQDVAVVVIKEEGDESNRYGTGVPVTIEWGWEQETSGFFYGYVHHNEPVTTPDGPRGNRANLKLVCVGAAWVTREPGNRVWTGRSVSSVIRGLADLVKFSGRIQAHSTAWPSLVQNGMSNWAFLVSLAQKVGWVTWVTNTELHFQDYLHDFVALRDEAPFFQAAGPQGQQPPHRILNFHVVNGDTTPDGGIKADRYLYGLDNRQVGIFAAHSDGLAVGQISGTARPPQFSLYESIPTTNYGEALLTLDGVSKANRWYIQARAELVGNPRVHQGMLVAMGGLGQRSSGYWYVEGVEHEISESYRMFVDLGRDSDWGRYALPVYRARKAIRQRTDPYGTNLAETPRTLLVNGSWRAAYSPRQYSAG